MSCAICARPQAPSLAILRSLATDEIVAEYLCRQCESWAYWELREFTSTTIKEVDNH